MRSRFALVIMKDIKDYFPPPKWRSEITKDGAFFGQDLTDISVKIDAKYVMYNVDVEAEDDPSDSTHKITNKPLDVLTKFLRKGMPGEEDEEETLKQKASIDPGAYAVMLRRIASDIEHSGQCSSKLMRRMIILPNFDLLHSIVKHYAAANPADFRMEERILINLQTEAKQKGWKFEITNDEPPVLHMVTHDFDVTIGVDSIMYDYEFELDGYPKSKEKGKTKDPIHEFEQWRFHSDKFQEAAEQYNRDAEREDQISTKPPTER